MTKFTRRDVLKIGAAGTATAILAGCSQESERWVELQPYVIAPRQGNMTGFSTYYATTCRMCPAACGILVELVNGRAIKIEGNPEHPISRGKTCARGQAGLQLLYNPDRVTTAVMQEERRSRRFKAIHWNEAINTLIERLNGAGAGVAVWTGSTTPGHLHDLFQQFTSAIGAPDPVRYDLYSAISGYHALSATNEALTGRFALPTYDLSHADAIFSFGADFLGTWHNATAYGVEYGQFRDQAFGKRGLFVQFEPRMTNTGAKADKWVPVQPGSEALVAQAIARIIADEQFGTAERSERAASIAPAVDLEAAALASALSVERLVELARAFALAEHPIAIPGESLAGRTNSMDALMAVQALNVIAGTIGEPGSMSLTPELSADIVPPRASTFEQAQALIERMKDGEIRVLLVHGANPAYDLPPALGFVDALDNVETVVSFNVMVDETSSLADYILPDRVYLEGWGYEVVNPSFQGLPVISGQQPVVEPFHDVRATGDVLLAVAQRLESAASALPWTDEVAFIREMITQLPAGARGSDDPDFQWARFQQFGGWWPETPPETDITITDLAPMTEVAASAFEGAEDEFPFFLHPYMSVLLSDGSGANIPWLQGSPDPLTTISWQVWVEVNPQTADQLNIANGDIVRVESPHGVVEALVYVFPAIRPDTIAIPFGQGHTDYGRYAKERGANPVQLLGTATGDLANWAWSNVRVRLVKTDRKGALAIFAGQAEGAQDAHVPF